MHKHKIWKTLWILILIICLYYTDLPSLSPLLHSALKLLERWSQALQVKLDSFPGPPRDFISQFPVSYETFPRGGPALLRYKALLDPGNTPFRLVIATVVVYPSSHIGHFVASGHITLGTILLSFCLELFSHECRIQAF